MSSLRTPLPNEDGSPNVQTIVTCGGDDISYQIPLSGPVMFYGTEFTSLYVTTNSVIAFGREDGTYWTWPETPSISLFSMDWWAIPQQRSDESFIISHSHIGFQVTLNVRPFANYGSAPLTTIVFTAFYNPDRTLRLSYYANNVDQYTTRTGVILPNDPVPKTFAELAIVQDTTIPATPGDPASSETTTRDTDRTDEESTEDTDRETDSETTSRDTDREPDGSEQDGSENNDIIDPIAPQLPVEPKPTEDPAVEPTPEPTPQKPSPQPTISPEKEPTPEPTPSEEPIEEPTENEPEPLPEPNETETPEPERELEVPEFIANIPLLGDLAESLVNFFNDLNKVGSDMSPEVREKAQKIVVVAIVVTQIVGVSAVAAMASTSRRKN
jgi:hypothetical protein